MFVFTFFVVFGVDCYVLFIGCAVIVCCFLIVFTLLVGLFSLSFAVCLYLFVYLRSVFWCCSLLLFVLVV